MTAFAKQDKVLLTFTHQTTTINLPQNIDVRDFLTDYERRNTFETGFHVN